MTEEVSIINLKSGRKVFYKKILSDTTTEMVVEVESKAGRNGKVSIPKAEIESVASWEAGDIEE